MRPMISRRSFVSAAGVLTAGFLAGCSQHEKHEKEQEVIEPHSPTDVRIAALKGPTAMGLVRFMSEVDAGNIADENYSFSIMAAPDELVPLIAKGEVDVAAVPANLAATLYAKTNGAVRVFAINTLGVLYLCDRGAGIASVEDLRGRTIYASGKGATPEFALAHVLAGHGLTIDQDVTIDWKSEHSACVAALTSDPEGVALLPQPFVTVAQTKDDSIRMAIDVSKEWDALHEKDGARLVTGVTVVRKDFLDSQRDAFTHMLDHYRDSVHFTQDHVDEAAALIGHYDIVPEPVAKKALPYCGITHIEAESMKTLLSGYLAVLGEQSPEAVGGKVPDDDFYVTAF